MVIVSASPLQIVDWAIYLLFTACVIILLVYWIYKLYLEQLPINSKHAKSALEMSGQSGVVDSGSGNSSSPDLQHDMSHSSTTTTTQTTNNKTRRSSLYASKTLKIQKSQLILCNVSLFLSVVYLCAVTVILNIPRTQHHCALFTWNYSLAFVARWSLYLYYIARTQAIFKSSAYAVSPCFFKFVIVWFTTGYSISAVSYLLIALGTHCGAKNAELNQLALVWPLLNELSISIFSLFYLIYKLRRLMRDMNKKMAKIRYVMRKLTVLALLTILTAFGALVSVVGSGGFCFLAIDTFINNLCLVLSFAFMDSHYRKICFVCVNCCRPREEQKLAENI